MPRSSRKCRFWFQNKWVYGSKSFCFFYPILLWRLNVNFNLSTNPLQPQYLARIPSRGRLSREDLRRLSLPSQLLSHGAHTPRTFGGHAAVTIHSSFVPASTSQPHQPVWLYWGSCLLDGPCGSDPATATEISSSFPSQKESLCVSTIKRFACLESYQELSTLIFKIIARLVFMAVWSFHSRVKHQPYWSQRKVWSMTTCQGALKRSTPYSTVQEQSLSLRCMQSPAVDRVLTLHVSAKNTLQSKTESTAWPWRSLASPGRCTAGAHLPQRDIFGTLNTT